MIRLAATLAAGILVLAGCDSGGSGGSPEAFCGLADEIQDFEDFGENVDLTDFESVSQEFDRIDDVLADAVDAAPDEIRDDVELVADMVGDLFAGMREPLRELSENREAASQNPEILQALQDAQPTEEEQEQLQDATQRIEQYIEDECDVDLDRDSGGGGTEGGDSGGGSEE